MAIPRVSIILLNWNGWRDTIECLESLYRITYPNYDVIVVDNASQDDSIQKIKEYYEGTLKVESKFFKYNSYNKPIKVFEISEKEARNGKFNRPLYEKFDVNRRLILIKNENNYGFAGGNNIGIKFALSVLNPDYILLLNNDTVVEKRFLDELIKIAEENEDIGAVGSALYFYDLPNTIQTVGGKINKWTGRREHMKGEHAIPQTYKKRGYVIVDFVPAASLLIKKEVIKNAGMLDEEYFLYVEDVDWCFRIKQKGYNIASALRSLVWHKVSASTGGIDNPKTFYYVLMGNLRFIRKHGKNYPVVGFLVVSIYYFLKSVITSTIKDPKKNMSIIVTIFKNEFSFPQKKK